MRFNRLLLLPGCERRSTRLVDGEDRRPFHLRRFVDAEEIEDGDRQVEDRRVGFAEPAARKQSAGHSVFRHRVVPAPRPGVEVDGRFSGRTEHRRRSDAVAGVIADQQLRHVGGELASVEVIAFVHPDDRRPSRFRIGEGDQFPGEPSLDLTSFLGCDDSLTLAILEVEVEAVEADAVGHGLRPVDVEDRSLLLLPGDVLDRQVAVVPQPGIEVELAGELGETVVGTDEEERIRVLCRRQDLADEPVHLLVQMMDVAGKAHVGLVVLRVGRVHVAPQHVRVLVGRGDVEVEKALVEA